MLNLKQIEAELEAQPDRRLGGSLRLKQRLQLRLLLSAEQKALLGFDIGKVQCADLGVPRPRE